MTDEHNEATYSVTDTDEASAIDWTSVPREPDLHRDLDYELIGWEVVHTPSSKDQTVFLPMDKSMLRDNAFIVAGPNACCDLGAKR